MALEALYKIYDGNYSRLLLIPAILFIFCIAAIFIYPGVTTGIDFEGGTRVIVRADSPIDDKVLEALLEDQFQLTELTVASISSPTGYGATFQYAENPTLSAAQAKIAEAESLLESAPEECKSLSEQAIQSLSNYLPPKDTSTLSAKQTLDAAKNAIIDAEEVFQVRLENAIVTEFNLGENPRFEKREVEPTLGSTFWESAITVVLTALILVVLVIFIFFREVIPSLAVIGAAAFDIAAALALMAIFQVPLSLSTISALLMLVGYSVDTDIMLTTRLIKRRESTAKGRTKEAMKTGLTMTFTTLTALMAMLTLSYFTQMLVIFEIALVLLFGLIGDLISTWLMNAPVLLWYVERKKGVKG